MVTIGMNYEVIPGKEELFESKFEAVINSFQDGSGHRMTKLFRDVHDPSSYVIHSEWETRDDFFRFIRSEAFRAVTNWGKEEILRDRPKHRIYTQDESMEKSPSA